LQNNSRLFTTREVTKFRISCRWNTGNARTEWAETPARNRRSSKELDKRRQRVNPV